MNKNYQITLYGATGFTGKLVAEFLGLTLGDSERWAIAGRNRQALEKIQERCKSKPDILIADSSDEKSLLAMAQQSKVICSTVGPYAKYGTAVVLACIDGLAHYCDLTGEVPWIHSSVMNNHENARQKKLRIVHCCGYDSVPFDIGTYLTQKFARTTYGASCTSVLAGLTGSKGGFSGGTVYSLLGVMEAAAKDHNLRKILRDPLSLALPGFKDSLARREQSDVVFREEFGWCAPHIMASINSRVIRRSQSLLASLYGTAMHYDEFIAMGPKLKGKLTAHLVNTAMKTFMGGLNFEPSKRLLQKFVLPAPGQGPSDEMRQNGYFNIKMIGHGKGPSGNEFKVTTHFKAKGDPGYAATSRMIGTCATLLARDEFEFSGNFGVLTPATVFGSVLPEKLNERGFKITTSGTEP